VRPPPRLAIWGGHPAGAAAALTDFIAGADSAAAVTGTALRDGKIAFVFAGNGAQWPEMGRSAYRANPVFQRALAQADSALRPALGWSITDVIGRRATAEELAPAD